MRTVPLAIVGALLVASCHPAVDVVTLVLHERERAIRAERARARPRVDLENRGAEGIVVAGDHFTFVVPAASRARGPNAFADPAERHAVAIATYEKALEPEAWARAYYPKARSWAATVDGRPVVFARAAAQITVLICASETDLYELTCAQSDASKAVPNAVCSDVLNSFRLR